MARARRRAWALTIAAAMLAVVWVVSMKFEVGAYIPTPPGTALRFVDGTFEIARYEPNRFDGVGGFVWAKDHWKAFWWFSRYVLYNIFDAPYCVGWRIPLWPFILLTGVPGVWMLAKSRRAKGAGANLCPSCGYDLTGLPTTPIGPAPCPECGKTA